MPILPEESVFFEELYRTYKDFLYYIAGTYTKVTEEQEDVVQEALVKLMRHGPLIRSLDKPRLCKYLSLTVKTAYLDSLRRKHDVIPLDDELLRNLEGKERELVPDLFMRWEVQKLRGELTPREWLALEGKYILGYSQEELGTLLGISPNSVRMLLCRVREKARTILYAGNVSGGGGIE